MGAATAKSWFTSGEPDGSDGAFCRLDSFADAFKLFGSRIPGIARSLGTSITEFKEGAKGIEENGDADAEVKPRT